MVATADGVVDTARSDRPLAGRRVTAVAAADDADPGDTGIAIWALVDGGALHRLTDSGAEHVATLDRPVGTCLHVRGRTVLVGGDDAGLWALHHDVLEPVTSFRDAPTRAAWSTPWGGPPAVFSIASHDADLYVNVHVGGILHTADGGRSWEATIDLHDDVHQVVVDPRTGTVWAATGRNGLAGSVDRGRTWTHHTAGLPATYLLAATVTSAGVVVGASSGHAARDGAVHVFDGSGFHRAEGLPDRLDGAIGPRRIAAAGAHAALVTPDGRLYVSDDGGHRWQVASAPLSSPAEVLVVPGD